MLIANSKLRATYLRISIFFAWSEARPIQTADAV
jgi:hypothetical protein